MGVATQLAFTTQPAGGAMGVAMPTFRVSVLDASNQVVADQVFTVVVRIGTNPSSGSPVGTIVVNTVNGVATFSNCAINYSGVGYTLTASVRAFATGAALTASVTSNSFTITGTMTATVRTAVSGADLIAKWGQSVSGDTVVMGAGTFALGDTALPRKDGVFLLGKDDTSVVTSTKTGNVAALFAGSNSCHSNFKLQLNGGTAWYALDSTVSEGALTGFILINVTVESPNCIDCWRVDCTNGAVDFQMVYCRGTSSVDTCNVALGSNAVHGEVAYCDFTLTASSNAAPNMRALSNDAAATGNIVINAYGCTAAFSDPALIAAPSGYGVQSQQNAVYNVYGMAFSGSLDYADDAALTCLDNSGGGRLNSNGATFPPPVSGLTDATVGVNNVQQLAVTQQPAVATLMPSGQIFSPQVKVTMQDSGGTTQPTNNNLVQVSLRAYTGSAVLNGTLSQLSVSGVSNFVDLAPNGDGTQSLRFASLGLTTVESNQFRVYNWYVTSPQMIVVRRRQRAARQKKLTLTRDRPIG